MDDQQSLIGGVTEPLGEVQVRLLFLNLRLAMGGTGPASALVFVGDGEGPGLAALLADSSYHAASALEQPMVNTAALNVLIHCTTSHTCCACLLGWRAEETRIHGIDGTGLEPRSI